MRINNSDGTIDLITEHPNIITEYKPHVLPHCIQSFAVIDVVLAKQGSVTIVSPHHPIRYGKHCGSQVILGIRDGKVDYNPKFFWNGKEYLLQTHGSFVFAEIEINGEPYQ